MRIKGFVKGYIMNLATKEIAEYLGTERDNTYEYPDTTPPFYTMTFKKEEFLDSQRHYEAVKNIRSHEDIRNYPGFEEQPGRGFIVGCHGNNISTAFNHPFKGRTLSKEEAENVMIKTGVLYSKPLLFKVSNRLKVRNLFNRLPFRQLLKRAYYSLPIYLRKL